MPILLFILLLLVFTPFILVSARVPKEEQRMRARFAMLQKGGAGGLSSGQQVELLKVQEATAAGWHASAVRHVARWIQLELLLLEANSQQSPAALMRNAAALACCGGWIAFLGTHLSLVAALAGVAAGSGPWLLLRWQARRRTRAMDAVLPQVLDMISRALRAGHSLPAALGIVAEEAAEPARTAFGEVFRKQRFGFPLRDALLEMIAAFPSDDLRVLATAMLVQRDTGGNLVQILERTSAVIRERLKLQNDIRVHTAQGRLTGWILCLLPVLMLVLLLLTNPSYPKVLLDDPFGRKLLYGGIFLLGLGAFLIQRIVNQIEV